MNEHNNIKGFFSYARQNDKHGGGNLSLLRKNLEIELREQTGENIEIFQDQEDISWGEFWKRKIITSLDLSKFLIAIVTPSYFKSEACRFELEYFLNLEKIIGSERILPLIYIETPELKNTKDPIFSEINSRQWFDWTKFRFSSLTSTGSKKQIAVFTRRICELIVNELSPANDKTNFNIPNSVISTTITEFGMASSSKIVTTPKSDPKHKKNDELPPPPNNFPDGWDMEWQPSFDEAAIAAKPEPKFKKNEPAPPPLITRAVTSMYVPLVKENKDKDHPPRQLTITLRSTGDDERDKRRIKTLHGLLTSYHGRDKFRFYMIENKKSYLIDFSNETTRICPELLAQLKKLIGEESWLVEEIAFQ